MNVIENFAELSEQEQRSFAEALVKTINTESTFLEEELKLIDIETDEMTGDLIIGLEGVIYLDRKATWDCSDYEDAEYKKPEDPEYENSIYDDIKKAFKNLSTEIDGYTLSLEIADYDDEEIEEVHVGKAKREEGGIGHYELWGRDEYDYYTYVTVEGTLTTSCRVYIGLYVSPTAVVPEETPEED